MREAARIAQLAGMKIKEIREKNQYQESLKYGYELVTTADIVSNEIIKTEISKVFHSHNIISEEDIEHKQVSIQNPTWIVDPIDGTVGYANDQYQVAVSIAYADENQVKAGVVYNPFLDEMFHAVRNSGAYLNNREIRIKDVRKLKECVIGTGFPHEKDDIREIMMRFEALLPRIRDIRRLGSPALDICWVACGRMQGFYEGKLYPWDVAAAKCIAIEAGAKTGYFNPDYTLNIEDCINGHNVIISSPHVFEELKQVLTINRTV